MLVTPSCLDHVRQALDAAEAGAPAVVDLQFSWASGGRQWLGTLHRHDGLAFLEAEPNLEAAPAGRLPRVTAASRRLQAASNLADACAIAAAEVRRLTGFERVMIYRFAEDWSGEVVGEDREPDVASYLDLHFPASDIPPQARELYRRNPIRIIPDAGYVPSPLVSGGRVVRGPIDLSYAVLRSVSPVHIEYLHNMDVGSSMSVSILRHGKLWGLIACHHRRPHHVGHTVRQACELLAQVLAWQLAGFDDRAGLAHGGEVKSVGARLVDDMVAAPGSGESGLERNSAALLALMGARGLAYYAGDRLTLLGETPDEQAVRDLLRWLVRTERPDVFATDRLPALYPPAEAYAGCGSGLLAATLSRQQRSFLLWFRPELVRTVTWGGDPRRPAEQEPGSLRLHPRRSFAAWSEEVRGRSASWASHHVVAAREIRDLLLESMAVRKEELEQLNTQLARSRDDLEGFVYAASHDLKGPLYQVEMLAGMLRDPDNAGDEDEIDARLRAALRRLRTLINELGLYSRAGQRDGAATPVELATVVDEARAALAEGIASAGLQVETAALPRVVGEAPQLRQVFVNLLANAIKYRRPDRVPSVRIEAAIERPAEGDELTQPGSPARRPRARITVADNGIGFDPQHAEAIFAPFKRLHTAEEYEGTGIGLTICRKIIEAHGGTIAATGRPGEGARFSFTLPLAEAA
jgi:light-regulated signal transduction histidine kinase (bacteriophytochrome)